MSTPPEHRAGLCPRFHYAVELIGRRWNGAILFLLQDGPARFGELPHELVNGAGAVGAALVVAVGLWLQKRARAKLAG